MNSSILFDRLRTHLRTTAERNGLSDAAVQVTAGALTSVEAIGNPEHDDYPLLTGRESMMQATLGGASGQAFTDMCGPWQGTLRQVLDLELANNFRRAVFVATLNAAMRLTGEVEDTRHCRDDGPVRCAESLPDYLRRKNLRAPYALFGLQPRLAEALATIGEVRVVDKDPQNIGNKRGGVTIQSPEDAESVIAGSQTLLVTGTTLVNDTIGLFLNRPMPVVFFGVTIAGAAKVLGLERYCACAL